MRVTVLVENSKNSSQAQLLYEHGLSLFIEVDDQTLLFDMGQSTKFVRNAERLGIDLAKVQSAVISHGHYDHGGGLEEFLKMNTSAPVFVGRGIDRSTFSKCGPFKHYIGLNRELFIEKFSRLHFVDKVTEILKGVYVIPKITQLRPVPVGNSKLLSCREGQVLPDDFSHEVVVAIEDEGELVVLTGCAHSGVVNILTAVREVFPDKKIKSVIGGFHLLQHPVWRKPLDSEEEYSVLTETLLNISGLKKIYTGHCTSKKAYERLSTSLTDKLAPLESGISFEV